MSIISEITCDFCGQIFLDSEFFTAECPTCGWTVFDQQMTYKPHSHILQVFDTAGEKLAEAIDTDVLNSIVEANKAMNQVYHRIHHRVHHRVHRGADLTEEIHEALDMSELEDYLEEDDKVLKWQEDMEKLTSCCVTLMGFCQRFGRFSDEDKVREMFRRIGNELYRESGLEVTDGE